MGKNLIKKKYDTDIQIIKIIAAFFVILLHSSDSDSFSGMFYNGISRFSVPVFVLVSGYNMLARKPDCKNLVKKCIKLFCLMLAWSAIYYSYGLLFENQSFTGIKDLLSYLLTEPTHLWYLYATLALYLFTPLLFVFHKSASRNEYRYALLLSFLFGSCVIILLRSDLIPILSVLLNKMKVPYTLGFICLFLTGGYLRRFGIQKKTSRLLLYLFGVAGAIVSVIGPLLLPKLGLARDLLLSFFAPNVMLAGIAFFVFLRQVLQDSPIRSQRLHSLIHEIASCTLGVYLLHMLILTLLNRFAEPFFLLLRPCLLIPLRTLLAALLSTGLVFAAKNIPVLKWLF